MDSANSRASVSTAAAAAAVERKIQTWNVEVDEIIRRWNRWVYIKVFNRQASRSKTFVIPKGLIMFLLRSRRFLEGKRDMDRRCTLMDVVRNPVNTVLQRREDKLEQRRKEVEVDGNYK
ncbi:hypothetical protein V1477_001903 [Vespula maculifrons]|uniref:Uncharacterized protein n=1 Tax=Vespula maculifrons TaxID=7453 RepID=A0ABD2CXG2_VESMC